MFTLKCKERIVVVDKPLVMGILNLTPDSFYTGSRVLGNLLPVAERMIADGADILDLGAQSTRPGATMIGPDEELARLIPAVEQLAKKYPDILLSVDTFYASVASAAVQAGASIINDISGGSFDPNMIETAGHLGVPYICMHVKGNSETMHQQTRYSQFLPELIDYFIMKVGECRAKGIHDLIIDPGFGFSKTSDQNFELLQNLGLLKLLNLPVLLGVSRKSTIYKTLGTTSENALNGTTVLNTLGLVNGACILRVHDVREAREGIILYEKCKKNGQPV